MRLAFVLLSTSALAVPAMAQAQAATDAPAAQEPQQQEQGFGEIIVTANRTASSAQDTPIALNVYSGDALRDAGISSVRDLAAIDPSVNISPSAGAAYVAVRGIASTDVTEIGDPSVPIARDGFYTNRPFSINASMYDLARIEVLKGPQGTLNGRNSTGGLISLITNRPAFTNGGYSTVEVGNYGAFTGEMGANLALSDHFAVRASGTFITHDGYRKLDGPAKDGDDENFASGRIQALYKNDGFSAWVSYQHDSRSVNGDAQFKSTLGGPKPSFKNLDPFPNDTLTSTRLEGDRFRWELAYATPGNLNFVYAGGYDKQHWTNVLDATGPSYPANRQFRQSETPTTWNHEFRVSNDSASRLFIQAGYFRFQENNTVDSGLYNLDMTGDYAAGGPLESFGQPDQYGIKFDYRIKTRSQALFAQTDYDITDQLQLTVGGRYTWDKKSRSGQAVLFLPALASPFAPALTLTTPGEGKLSESQPTWHVGLNYRPMPNTLIYAKYDRGYKSGGFNSNGSAASVPYGPEKLDAFELGTKNSFMGNTLQVNADVFYSDYKGYQASQTSSVVDGGSGTFNVGSAKILGAEAEVKALLGEHTRIGVSAAYLHTKFGSGIVVNDGDGNPIDISGNRLPNAPSFTTTASIDQDFAVGGGKVTAHLDGKYSSSYYFSVFNLDDVKTSSFFMANASLSYEPEVGGWKVQAFVRNIFDKNVLAYAQQNFVSHTDNYQFQPPRTYGVRASVNF
ncbi:TonB-dependent receptor [Sphingomonas sp. IC081]|uniref:TonB-dependent receptor n=1 Tax=Sphingomonas sp. IC081 TaxID=304378 RepID=UPI00163CA165|nr:TonB-dependent receptor [Sphingomonas sp. IC081]